MPSPFRFDHLECSASRDTGTVFVTIRRPPGNALDDAVLDDLEAALGRLAAQGGVNSILIGGFGGSLSDGLDRKALGAWGSRELGAFNERLKTVVTAMALLPQAVVVDLGGGARGHGLELALGADIRVARGDARLEFDFLANGLCPGSGGIAHLQKLVGHATAKFWVMGSQGLSGDAMKMGGLVHETYGDDADRKALLDAILGSVGRQAPVARAQAKRSFFESFAQGLGSADAKEGEFARAAHYCEDWKVPFQDDGAFTSIKAMRRIVRLMHEPTTEA